MAVLGYNSNLNNKKDVVLGGSSRSTWTIIVKTDPSELANAGKKKLIVTYNKTKEKYIVDGFKNRTRRIFDETDLWCSFDTVSGNFHIIPDKETKFEDKDQELISVWLKNRLNCVKKCIKAFVKEHLEECAKGEVRGDISEITIQDRGGYGEAPNENHMWVCVNSKKNQYLMSFNRLWCDASGGADKTFYIHNNFGQAQFMCYPREKGHGDINSFPNGFKLMYPTYDDDDSNDDEKWPDSECGHRVYNAPYDINSSAEEIAKAFVDFIRSCENDQTS